MTSVNSSISDSINLSPVWDRVKVSTDSNAAVLYRYGLKFNLKATFICNQQQLKKRTFIF